MLYRYLVPGAGAVWTWRQAGAPECTEWWVAGGLCWPGMGAGLLISPLAGLSSVQVPVLHRGHHTISWTPAACSQNNYRPIIHSVGNT